MRKTFLAAICLLLSMAIHASEVTSPNGEIKVIFSLNGSVPTYQVTFRGQEVIRPSRLGFELMRNRGGNLLDGFTVKSEETATFDETWQPVWGENRQIRNHYNELLVKLTQDATNRNMNIRFRVYDDGVGLRYEFPQEGRL